MMELQQRHSVSPNVYDHGNEGETTEAKTEDIYQSLQYPPTAAQRTDNTQQSALGKKMILLLLALIALLLTILIIISVVHYSHFRQTLGAMSRPNTNKEIWLLHDDAFYLFWSERGDCNTAEEFCARRKARLATVTEHNMAWLQSQTNGKQLMVRRGQSDGSGDAGLSILMDEDDTECDLLGVTPDLHEQQAEGWVCGRAAL